MGGQVSETQWLRLSEFIAETTGLHFPRERSVDLQRGVAEAARELGFEDPAACVGRLLSAPPTRLPSTQRVTFPVSHVGNAGLPT